jgi:16S rRNA (guanine527-N7)-methyltransferase
VDKLSDGVAHLGQKIDNRQLEQFETYYRELIDWNRRVNLTAITDYDDVQIKHFLDSLTVVLALKRPFDQKVLKVIDVGTGAGFPGIPLKITLPKIRLTLLETTVKRVRFLEHITNILGLKGVEILTGRAEVFGRSIEYREKFDVVLSRAVAALPSLVELALPFCAAGGNFIAQKQTRVAPEVERAKNAVSMLGGELREIINIDLPGFSGNRCLVVYDKIAPTPFEYPRRPGIPAKKPLA